MEIGAWKHGGKVSCSAISSKLWKSWVGEESSHFWGVSMVESAQRQGVSQLIKNSEIN
jgi:hypothetical protein